MNTLLWGCVFRRGFFSWFPEMAFQAHAGLDDGYTFAFEEVSLQGSVRLADEAFAAFAEDAMPGDAFSGRSCVHGASTAAGAPGTTQGITQRPIRSNPPPRPWRTGR